MGMASPLSFELLSNAMKFALFYHNKKKYARIVINIAEVSEEIFDDSSTAIEMFDLKKEETDFILQQQKYSPLI